MMSQNSRYLPVCGYHAPALGDKTTQHFVVIFRKKHLPERLEFRHNNCNYSEYKISLSNEFHFSILV